MPSVLNAVEGESRCERTSKQYKIDIMAYKQEGGRRYIDIYIDTHAQCSISMAPSSMTRSCEVDDDDDEDVEDEEVVVVVVAVEIAEQRPIARGATAAEKSSVRNSEASWSL